jgi:hypothetical protein
MYRVAADLSLSLVEAQNLLLLNIDMFICYDRIACRFIDNIQDGSPKPFCHSRVCWADPLNLVNLSLVNKLLEKRDMIELVLPWQTFYICNLLFIFYFFKSFPSFFSPITN